MPRIIYIEAEMLKAPDLAQQCDLADAWLWRTAYSWALGINATEIPSAWDGFAEVIVHATPLEGLNQRKYGVAEVAGVPNG